MIDGIRHIVWDWNGTLLDDTPACVQSLNRVLDRRGLPPVTCEQYRDIFGFPVQDYYRKLGMTFTPAEWDELTREFHDYYADYSRDTPLREGIAETLAALRGRGMPMSVLSASEIGILERMLGVRGIRGFFEHVCGLSNLDAHSKLDVGRELTARLALPPEQVLLVGDTTHDYEVARDLKWPCVLLTGGHQSEPRLRQCGCDVVSDPAEYLLGAVSAAAT